MVDYMLIGSVVGKWLKDAAVTGIMKIFFWLDTIIYRIAGWTYKIFYIMGSITLDADETVNAITNKVYTILLIFMVFVVAYNMLIYIINPDKIKATDDKVPTGAGNLVKKIAISLVVIVASPYFFDLLYEVQVHVVEYNVVGTIILGNGGDSNSNSACNVSGIGSSGDALVADVYTSFLYPLNGMMASDCCDGSMTQEQLDGDSIASEYCEAYMDARDKGAIGGFADIQDAAVDGDDYQYLGVVSTIAGAVMVVYFLGFCIYLGVRLFKLLVLELIAPIPALLELVPGKSGTLSNWFKTVMSVWAQVFVYQAIVFSLVWLATLVPGLLSEVNASINQSASGATNGFLLLAKVLLIIALFQACKEVPKMVTDVLGIKGGTGILKAAGLQAFGLGASAFGVASNALKNFSGYAKDGHILKGAASAVAGGASSLARNTWGLRNANSIKDIQSTTKSTNAKVQQKRLDRQMYKAENPEWYARIRDTYRKVNTGLADFVGVTQNYDETKHLTKEGEYIAKRNQLDALNNYQGKMKNAFDLIKDDADVKYFQNLIDEMKRTGQSEIKVGTRADGSLIMMTMDEALHNQKDAASKAYGKKRGDIIKNILEMRQDGANHQELKSKGVIDNKDFAKGGRYDIEQLDFDKFNDMLGELMGKQFKDHDAPDPASLLKDSITNLSSDQELRTRMERDALSQARREKSKAGANKVNSSSDATKNNSDK